MMPRLVVIAVLLPILAGCATMTRGTRQAFTVTSEPSNANVQFSTGQTCTTPCTLELPRGDDFQVTVTREGYQEQTANVVSAISGGGGAGMAGNVVFGGLIGAGVDAASGAMNDLQPNPLHIELEPVGDEESE